MRHCRLLFLCLIALGVAACASKEEPRDEDLDFFERIAKNQEERESSRRDTEQALRKGKKIKKTQGDGTLAYYEQAKKAKTQRAPIRVTWEGLAREREVAANSKYNRPGSIQPPMKITLVSESHPDSTAIKSGRTKEGRAASASSAVLADADLVRLVKSLQERGFYKYAQPTDLQAASAAHPRARGQVTIERNGQSVTLISMRGQGTNPATKPIPGIYSDSKRAIMEMRNRAPGLSLTSVETDSILPGFGN